MNGALKGKIKNYALESNENEMKTGVRKTERHKKVGVFYLAKVSQNFSPLQRTDISNFKRDVCIENSLELWTSIFVPTF